MPAIIKNPPANRPTDILKPSPKPRGRGNRAALSRQNAIDLPDTWVTIIDAADEWPYLNPDAHGLLNPEVDFSDYPSDPSLLPDDIEPFSEDEPWGKMIAETNREYSQFSHYRAQGLTRTHTATSIHFGVKRTTISLLSKNRNWEARVQAWDLYRERVYTTELLLGVKEMAHTHAEVASRGIKALAIENEGDRQAMFDELAELPVKTQLLLAQKSAAVLPNLMNAERLSRGLPTEISAELHLHDVRVSVQSTDDLANILLGLAGPLSVAQGDQSVEIEAEAIEDDA